MPIKRTHNQPNLISNKTNQVIHPFLFMRLNSKMNPIPFVVGSTHSYHLILKIYCNWPLSGKTLSVMQNNCVIWYQDVGHWSPFKDMCKYQSDFEYSQWLVGTYPHEGSPIFLGRNESAALTCRIAQALYHFLCRHSICLRDTYKLYHSLLNIFASVFDNQVERCDRPSLYTLMQTWIRSRCSP